MKIIISGGPSSGKTCLLNELKKRGYNIIPDVAREIIIQRKNFPQTPEEISLRQKLIIKKRTEEEHKSSGLVFTEYSLIDMYVFTLHLTGKPAENQFNPHYKYIFILEHLPFVNDRIRIEKNEEEANIIHNKIVDEYKRFGYAPIFVPVMSVEQRADFVLNYLKEQGIV